MPTLDKGYVLYYYGAFSVEVRTMDERPRNRAKDSRIVHSEVITMKAHYRSILISILVVAGLLGILAAIAIPNLMAWQRRENILDRNMVVFSLAVQDYARTHAGQFPPTATDAIVFAKSPLQNPWTGLSGQNEAWMDGTASKLGVIGYEHVQPDSVRVTGYGTKGATLGAKWSEGGQAHFTRLESP